MGQKKKLRELELRIEELESKLNSEEKKTPVREKIEAIVSVTAEIATIIAAAIAIAEFLK